MGTAGDDYLSRMLGTGQATDGTPTEVTEAEAKARLAEEIRAFNARFNPFGDGSATATTTMNGGGGSGGGYRFDAETIKSKITQWEQLLDELIRDGLKLQALPDQLVAPSADKPAVNQLEASRRSLNAARDHNSRMQQYAQAYIDALKKANGTYVQHDQHVASGIDSSQHNATGIDK